MITGDHRATACCGRSWTSSAPGELTPTGPELTFYAQEVLEEDIHRFFVFARVSPEHKMRIVQAWQKRGLVVAMTGTASMTPPP